MKQNMCQMGQINTLMNQTIIILNITKIKMKSMITPRLVMIIKVQDQYRNRNIQNLFRKEHMIKMKMIIAMKTHSKIIKKMESNPMIQGL